MTSRPAPCFALLRPGTLQLNSLHLTCAHSHPCCAVRTSKDHLPSAMPHALCGMWRFGHNQLIRPEISNITSQFTDLTCNHPHESKNVLSSLGCCWGPTEAGWLRAVCKRQTPKRRGRGSTRWNSVTPGTKQNELPGTNKPTSTINYALQAVHQVPPLDAATAVALPWIT
jgi:hypothetical protein